MAHALPNPRLQRRFTSSVFDSTTQRDNSSQMQRLSTIPSAVSSAVRTLPTNPTAGVKKPHRTRTSYQLAQPPPNAHHITRPSLKEPTRALIVQLHRLSRSTRSVPMFDVLPAAVLGSKLQKCGMVFKNGVGQQDLVFLSAERYDVDDSDSDGGECGDELSSRQVVASISQGPRGNRDIRTTSININEGPHWEASALASGGYEFLVHDGEGGKHVVASWKPKMRGNSRRRTFQPGQRQMPTDDERKFQFSIYDESTGRRPIIAWMSPTRQTIDVSDHFPLAMTSSCPTSPACTPPSTFRSGSNSDEPPAISTMIRLLALITGTWVAIQEGFGRGYTLPTITASVPATFPRSPSSTPAPDFQRAPKRQSQDINPLGSLRRKPRPSVESSPPADCMPIRRPTSTSLKPSSEGSSTLAEPLRKSSPCENTNRLSSHFVAFTAKPAAWIQGKSGAGTKKEKSVTSNSKKRWSLKGMVGHWKERHGAVVVA